MIVATYFQRAVIAAFWFTSAGCAGGDWLGVEAPKQTGVVNPMAKRGEKSFDQRKRDCWEMPSAQACYEVGMNHEMGFTAEPNFELALEFYDKACDLEHADEHCNAAKDLRKKQARTKN